MWPLIAFVGLVVMVTGIVGVIHPIARLYLSTRGRAVFAATLGLVMLSVGAVQIQSAPGSVWASPEEQVLSGLRAKYHGAVELTVEGRQVLVHFNVADDLAEDARWTTNPTDEIRQGARLDVKSILEGVGASGLDYDSVKVQGWYPLPDSCGEMEEVIVVDADYQRGTVDDTDWSKVSPDTVYSIADSAKIHNDFRERQ